MIVSSTPWLSMVVSKGIGNWLGPNVWDYGCQSILLFQGVWSYRIRGHGHGTSQQFCSRLRESQECSCKNIPHNWSCTWDWRVLHRWPQASECSSFALIIDSFSVILSPGGPPSLKYSIVPLADVLITICFYWNGSLALCPTILFSHPALGPTITEVSRVLMKSTNGSCTRKPL